MALRAGDIVRCTNATGSGGLLVVGQSYTVLRAEDAPLISVGAGAGDLDSWSRSRFELIQSPPLRPYCRLDKLGNVMTQYATLEQAVDAVKGNPVGDTIYKLSFVARVTTVTNVEKF